MSCEEFQDGHRGSHLECGNGTNLAILNLHVSSMPLIKFQLNPTYLSEANVDSRFSSWPPWWPSWILGHWNRTTLAILNLHVTQMPPTKFWAQSDLQFWSRHGLNFQDGHHGSHLGYQKGTILAILNLYVAPIPPIQFQLNPTYSLGEKKSFENFQDGRHGGHVGYRNGMILVILTLHVAPMPPIKFGLNLT